MARGSPAKIDVHKAREEYGRLLDQVSGDDSICAANRELIRRFLRDCELGKTILRREKKRIRSKRLVKYLRWLPKISAWLGNKDFSQVTQDDMENFIARVEANTLTLQKKHEVISVTYAAWTRRDIKLIVRKFYKWLLGENRHFPPLVDWIETFIVPDPPDSLSVSEIRKCVDRASTLRSKALLWTLFETGARAEEFLNIRLGQVEDRETHFLVRLEYPKTYRRTLPVFEGAAHLREWIQHHPSGRANDQLFPLTYGGLRQFLIRLGARALGRRVHAQLLRDSFATWLAAKKVGRYQMCKLMGWAMSSNMPDRYIDRAGVVEEETIESIRRDKLSITEDENSELRSTVSRLKIRCQELEAAHDVTADRDSFLTTLLADKEVIEYLTTKIMARKLEARLEQL